MGVLPALISTKILFVSCEDLAGIMGAGLQLPLACNRNPAAEHGARGQLVKKIG
ncbi:MULTISPECIES: hypothetical protein [unclassified Novosphingobium]|uniref:hypothetical protein n=1 Tax=unclassified Novosphingobium TaxID=2644732 RepID=UPI001358D41A|nr:MULTISPECIES: hypothetical protein [unclassified Novosphingobium]